MREKMVGLIRQIVIPYFAEQIADHLISNDVVPVVRCKDCKNYHADIGWCNGHSHFIDADGDFCHPFEGHEWKMFEPDFFCADGDRRRDDGNG